MHACGPICLQALGIAQGVLKHAPKVASGIYANLGAAFQAMGDFPKAVQLFEKAKEILQLSDEDSVSLGSVLANLANAYQVETIPHART
jgi:tetratricopeptide (TPR) repeat protein